MKWQAKYKNMGDWESNIRNAGEQEGLEDQHSFVVHSCICNLWLVLRLRETCLVHPITVVEHVPPYGGTGEQGMRIKQPKKQPTQGHIVSCEKVTQPIQSDAVI